MEATHEFHYRLAGRVPGPRPGAHASAALGGGQAFATHARLFDRPDPRRLDLRASLRTSRPGGGHEWLVRVQRQRSAVAVHAVVDLSASMHFGGMRTKLAVAADFVEALATSAFRVGDPLGMAAFGLPNEPAWQVPARHGRGIGAGLAERLRSCARPIPTPEAANQDALAASLASCLAPLAGRAGLVFLVSDFLLPLAAVSDALEALSRPSCVPIIVSDPAEQEPPAANGWLEAVDAESGARRSLWLGERLRGQWRERAAAQRRSLLALFAAHGVRAFEMQGRFVAEELSRYFLEGSA